MNKKSTVWISTSRHHIKDHAFSALKNQIEQRLHEPSSTAVSNSVAGGSSSSTSLQVNTISNSLSEPPTYYTTNGVILYDDEGIRWGEIINQIPVGDTSSITAIQINAVLSGIDSNNFSLPSRAQLLTDVWFDNLHAEPTVHYIFYPETLVNTVGAQGSGVVITALYLNKDES